MPHSLSSEVTLYGFTSTGKTSFMYAFIWAGRSCCIGNAQNHSNGRLDMNFMIKSKSHPNWTYPDPEEFHFNKVKATQGRLPYRTTVKIERTPNNPSIQTQLLSCFEHTIALRDQIGGNFQYLVLDKQDGNGTGQIAHIHQDLNLATDILVFLDPNSMVEGQHNLIRYLEHVENDNGKRIALCVTKMEQMREQWLEYKDNPKDLLREYFEHMDEALDIIEDRFGAENVRTFLTSAAGFVDGDRERPNYDSNTDQLLEERLWKPCQILHPIFWLLEEKERSCVSPSEGDSYIGYDLPPEI